MSKKAVHFILCVIIIILFSLSSATADLKVHFINVGQGDSILVQCDKEFLLVDAGPVEAGPVVNSYLRETLDDLAS